MIIPIGNGSIGCSPKSPIINGYGINDNIFQLKTKSSISIVMYFPKPKIAALCKNVLL